MRWGGRRKSVDYSDDMGRSMLHACRMIDHASYVKAAGARLRLLRLVVWPDDDIDQFAKCTGTDAAELLAWEAGVTLVDPCYVSALQRLFGVTYDWIFEGRRYGLSVDLADRLG